MVALRPLRREELPLVWTIDRAERIDGIYRMRDGELVLEPARIEVHGWHPDTISHTSPLLAACYDRGGDIVGAFDDPVLAGVAALDTVWRGPRRDLLQLVLLHVDRRYRDQGLGRQLFARAEAGARARGARGLYVSATPSRHTVSFYHGCGCRVLAEPDPELFALEPEDIHLICAL